MLRNTKNKRTRSSSPVPVSSPGLGFMLGYTESMLSLSTISIRQGLEQPPGPGRHFIQLQPPPQESSNYCHPFRAHATIPPTPPPISLSTCMLGLLQPLDSLLLGMPPAQSMLHVPQRPPSRHIHDHDHDDDVELNYSAVNSCLSWSSMVNTDACNSTPPAPPSSPVSVIPGLPSAMNSIPPPPSPPPVDRTTIAAPMPKHWKWKTIMCKNGPSCRFGSSCNFAHNKAELRQFPLQKLRDYHSDDGDEYEYLFHPCWFWVSLGDW